MFRKGSMLIQVIIMVFFIGIMVFTFLPILNSSINSYRRIKTQDEMIYIGEMVIEKLKSQIDEENSLINDIDSYGMLNYEDEDFDKDKYKCEILKTNSNDNILELIVRVESKEEGNTLYVEFTTVLPKK